MVNAIERKQKTSVFLKMLPYKENRNSHSSSQVETRKDFQRSQRTTKMTFPFAILPSHRPGNMQEAGTWEVSRITEKKKKKRKGTKRGTPACSHEGPPYGLKCDPMKTVGK